MKKALEMKHISKRFGGVHALRDVCYDVYAGQVNILMGENGAGKSTLMKVLSGAILKDEGDIYIEGEKVSIITPHDALSNGVAMIYQELNVVPQMTVEANMSLGKEAVAKFGFVKQKQLIADAQQLLDSYGIDIRADMEVSQLSLAERQMLEIAKALAANAKIIVMDEPTSSLTAKETEGLFQIIRRLTSKNCTIIYISHRMEEVFEIGNHVAVMRDGELIGNWPIEEVDQQKLISYMVGRTIDNLYPKETVPIGDVVLEVEHLSKENMYQDISFSVRQGEILGLSGLVGAGRTEIGMSIFGAIQPDSGEIKLHGKPVNIKSPVDAIQEKIAYIPEDRKSLALDLRAKISHNIALVNLDELCGLFNFISKEKESRLCQQQIKKFRIKTPSDSLPVSSLSGGNQQKVVLGKWLAQDLDVLILDEPTRGIDVGSKEEIHKLIVQLARQNLAIILISSELPEILGMSDRILVMCEGKMAGIFDADKADQELIMAYSIGAIKQYEQEEFQ